MPLKITNECDHLSPVQPSFWQSKVLVGIFVFLKSVVDGQKMERKNLFSFSHLVLPAARAGGALSKFHLFFFSS